MPGLIETMGKVLRQSRFVSLYNLKQLGPLARKLPWLEEALKSRWLTEQCAKLAQVQVGLPQSSMGSWP